MTHHTRTRDTDAPRARSLWPASLIVLAALVAAPQAGAQTATIDRGPAVPDLVERLRQMNGQTSTHLETWLNGWDPFMAAIEQGDHPQGITMTSTGRFVVSYSRKNAAAGACSGTLLISDRFEPDNPGKDLDWTYYCEPGAAGGLEWHPSTLQASGEVVIVGTHSGSRFYHVPATGPVEHLAHLDMRHGGRDASGLVYNHTDQRFYALNGDGAITPATVATEICRTDAGVSLFDDSTSFDECKTINAMTSGQGSNLMMSADGGMYLVSAFSTHGDPPQGKGEWGRYGAYCETETIGLGLLGYGERVAFEDILSVSRIDWTGGRASEVFRKDISRTQRAQSCVHKRPAFRFGGGVAALENGDLIGLWSGRQNPPVLEVTRQYEISVQRLEAPGTARLSHAAAIDCNVTGIGSEGTANTITATFLDANRRELGRTSQRDITAANCDLEWIDFEVDLRAPAEFVKIETDGTDGFMVDQIVLSRAGQTVKTYGLNNDKGWCLSRDEEDGRGSWIFAADGICVPWHMWSFSGATVTGLPYDAAKARRGTTGQTKVRYSVDIDCDATGIGNEATGNTITGVFYDARGAEIGRGTHKEDTTGTFGGCYDIEFDVVTDGKAASYELHTDGSDAAFLDQIYVYEDGREVNVQGVSNDRGWCLSTDKEDASRSWKGHAAYNTCRSFWPFDM